MVNETSGENLLEFSKKMLDEHTSEETLPLKIEDPSKEKNIQTSTTDPSPTTSEPIMEPQTEQKEVETNDSSPIVNEHNRFSSDSVTSTKSGTSITSDDTKDNSVNLIDSTIEAPLRSPGFMERRLKRRSIIGSGDESNLIADLVGSQPVADIETDNSSHLFWVPAHLHPEIAPNEFRKWLKNHAKDGFSSGIGSLKRRKSTLSKQYIPSEADEEEEETTDKKMVESPTEKRRTSFDWESYGGSEENISPAAESTKLNILRRSLSLNLPPFMGGTISNPNDPNIFDRHSSPDVDSKVLVPRMSPALKRAARTKIRRNSVAGDQNPRRFSAHRRTRSTHVSSDKGKQSENNNNMASKIPKRKSESLSVPSPFFDEKLDIPNITDNVIIVNEPEEIRKDIELDCIDVKDGVGPIRITLKDDGPEDEIPDDSIPLLHITDEDELSSDLQIDEEPQESLPNLLDVNTSEQAKPVQTGIVISPSTSPTSTSPISTSPSPTSPSQKRSSAWSWLWPGGSDEKSKDKEKDSEKDKEEKEPKTKKSKSDKSEKSDKNENENNDSIVKEKPHKKSFTSIFSWQNKTKSTTDDSSTTNTTTISSQQNNSNKKTKYTNYNRLPIHVERAIYRLSHTKLANPRRPLHEQVLISNMMFWYLSLINKQQTEYGGSGNPNAEMAAAQVKIKMGKGKNRGKRKKLEKKSGLTKKGSGSGSSSEIAFKAPQYDVVPKQYMTPTILASHSNEFEEETVEDYGNNDYDSEEEIKDHSYHHYNDGYLSDGTDGGYLDETNGKIESSHGGGLLHSSAEFDDNIGESSSGVKNKKKYARSPSPNGRPVSPDRRSKSLNESSTTSQRNSVPPSTKNKLSLRNRSSSAGAKSLNNHNKISKASTVSTIADDEDDDVPLGLFKKLGSGKT